MNPDPILDDNAIKIAKLDSGLRVCYQSLVEESGQEQAPKNSKYIGSGTIDLINGVRFCSEQRYRFYIYENESDTTDNFKNAFAPFLDKNGEQIKLGDTIQYHSKRDGWLIARITQLKIVQKIDWDDSVSLRRTIRVQIKGKPRWDRRILYRVDRVEKIFDVD